VVNVGGIGFPAQEFESINPYLISFGGQTKGQPLRECFLFIGVANEEVIPGRRVSPGSIVT